MIAHTSAPTVRPNPAQGIALGCAPSPRRALKGRSRVGASRVGQGIGWAALSGLRSFPWGVPRALPWAVTGCPVGAETGTDAGTRTPA